MISVLAATLLAACACRSEGALDAVESERRAVVRWTLPPGGSVGIAGKWNRRASRADVTWEIVAPMTWPEYREWSSERRHRDYHQRPAGDGSLSFARLDQADHFLVDVSVIAPGPPVRARVTFTAQPD